MESNAFAPSGRCSLSFSLSIFFVPRFFPCQLPPREARFVAWILASSLAFPCLPGNVWRRKVATRESSPSRSRFLHPASDRSWKRFLLPLFYSRQNTSQLLFLDHRIIGSSKIYDIFFFFLFSIIKFHVSFESTREIQSTSAVWSSTHASITSITSLLRKRSIRYTERSKQDYKDV